MDSPVESDLVEDEAEDKASEESKDDETVPSLVPKPMMKSAVRNYFRIESDNNRQPYRLSKLICTKCQKPVSATHGNTSNLFTHLCRKHPVLFAQVDEKRKHKKTGGKVSGSLRSKDQPKVEHAFTISQKYDRKSKK